MNANFSTRRTCILLGLSVLVLTGCSSTLPRAKVASPPIKLSGSRQRIVVHLDYLSLMPGDNIAVDFDSFRSCLGFSSGSAIGSRVFMDLMSIFTWEMLLVHCSPTRTQLDSAELLNSLKEKLGDTFEVALSSSSTTSSEENRHGLWLDVTLRIANRYPSIAKSARGYFLPGAGIDAHLTYHEGSTSHSLVSFYDVEAAQDVGSFRVTDYPYDRFETQEQLIKRLFGLLAEKIKQSVALAG